MKLRHTPAVGLPAFPPSVQVPTSKCSLNPPAPSVYDVTNFGITQERTGVISKGQGRVQDTSHPSTADKTEKQDFMEV